VSYRKLLIGMLLTLVPVSIAGFYSLSHSEHALERMVGGHFQAIAESTATEVSQYIHDRVLDVGVMAIDPAVLDTVQAANRAYQGLDNQAASTRIEKFEKIWNTPAAGPMVQQILASPASRSLRRHRDLDRRFLRITVTDEKGAVVAATHKTLDYFQADEEFWQAIYAQGRGAINLTDILYDEVTKSNYIGVGVPVLEEGTNRFLGALDALIDVSTLFPLMNRAPTGGTARVLLVKDDGTVIGGPQISLAMNYKSAEYAALRDSLQTLGGRQTGYLATDVPGGGRRLIGFADTGLKQDYRNLSWVVLVSQDDRDALAPVNVVGRLLAALSLLALATVTVSGVYFSLHRRVPFAVIDELHRQPPKVSQT